MVESEWTEVKTKKKSYKPKPEAAPQGQYGGIKKGGGLVAGPISATSAKYGGSGAYGGSDSYGGGYGGGSKYDDDDDWNQTAPAKPKGQASAIADYDFGVDKNAEEKKYELVSHICATEVSEARTKKGLTQTKLAGLVNEKPTAIVDLERGVARYNADLINRIEKVLGVKINRGRGKKPKK